MGENQKQAILARVQQLVDDITVASERISIYKIINMDEELREKTIRSNRKEIIAKKKEIIQILETNMKE